MRARTVEEEVETHDAAPVPGSVCRPQHSASRVDPFMADLTDLGSGSQHDPVRGSPVGCDVARLLERAANGDEAAFAALYDLTSGLCFGLAVRVLGDEADAERITREAYVHLWTHSGCYDPSRGSAIAWIAGVVHARAVAHLRFGGARPDDAGAPRVLRDVADAVAGLSPAEREAVELAYFEGRTCSEVARRERVSLAMAAARIRDGLLAVS